MRKNKAATLWTYITIAAIFFFKGHIIVEETEKITCIERSIDDQDRFIAVATVSVVLN